MLVQLCDPLWRKLTPDEKKMWNQKAKEEHARQLGRKVATPGDPTLRMDCNRKYISERTQAEKAVVNRRERERKVGYTLCTFYSRHTVLFVPCTRSSVYDGKVLSRIQF